MSDQAAATPDSPIPLCVDLDGTLIKTDLLWESTVRLLGRNPLWLLVLPFWLIQGRAFLKRQIASHIQLDVGSLPFHDSFLTFLRAAKQQGQPLILATASDREMAQRVADHVGGFADVLGSDGRTNLRGRTKLDALVQRFGHRGFDYAGNSPVDLPVWREARHAIVVNGRDGLIRRVAQAANVSKAFPAARSNLAAVVRALRPHQWLKNLIVFVPLVASHKISQWPLVASALLAFVAFSLCASGTYVLNDLLDLEADRQHVTKKLRPFASGDLQLQTGLVLVSLLLLASFVAGAFLSPGFLGVLALYLVVNAAYSCWLKQVALLDAFVLAGLYTLRLIAGHEATGVAYSNWLLMFSMFIFLSLALVKRFQELRTIRQSNQAGVKGRGYLAEDLELVAALGAGSGFLAVLVLALYVNSHEVLALYRHPMLLLLACPLLLFWISRVWMVAHRGQMRDDPVVFALRDRASYVVGLLTVLVILLATGR